MDSKFDEYDDISEVTEEVVYSELLKLENERHKLIDVLSPIVGEEIATSMVDACIIESLKEKDEAA